MMYQVNVFRGRRARRFAVIAAAVGFAIPAARSLAATEETFVGTGGITTWNTASAWSNSVVPASGSVADIFKTVGVSYNVTTTSTSLLAVQIAGNTSSGTAVLNVSSSFGTPYLKTQQLYIGAGVTGQNGLQTGAGPGQLNQSAGTVVITPLGVVAIDPNSQYTLSGTGTVLSAYTEQNQGTFYQNGGANNLASGSVLTNTGTYIDLNAGRLGADSIINNGIFNQGGGTVLGTSTTQSFTNNGTFFYSAGNYTGNITNNSIMTTTGTTLTFTGALINNGKLTVTNATSSFGANISGSGLIVFNGSSSAVTVTGNNTFTGQTTIGGGTVMLGSAVGTSANNFGGALQGNIIIQTGATLENTADLQIANTSPVTINGGVYNLNSHDDTIASLSMTSGMVQETTGVGLGVNSGQVTIGNGTATITGGLRSNNPFNFNVAGTGALNVTGSIGGYNGAAGSLILSGGGTMSISGASPLSTIDVKSGKLQLSESGTLGAVNVSTTIETGATLSMTNQSLMIGDLFGSGGVSLGTGALTVVSTGTTFPGTIAGSGTFTKSGAGTLVLTGADSSSGLTDIAKGNLTVASSGSISGSSITVEAGAAAMFNGAINSAPAITANGSVVFGPNTGPGILVRNVGTITVGTNTGGGNGVAQIAYASNHANRTLLIASGIALAGTTNAWTGLLDITDNDMDLTNTVLSTVSNQIKNAYGSLGTWNGNGIGSSTAAADSTHLTAVGSIVNNDGFGNPVYGTGAALGLFDGYSPGLGDVLLKYTYYGDANLDGTVDGSDYSRVDNGFLHQLSGWYNGDFNYDGVVDGSDYTLIDNTFNQQGAALSAQVASQIQSSSSVPEPASLGLSAAALAMLARRRCGGINR